MADAPSSSRPPRHRRLPLYLNDGSVRLYDYHPPTDLSSANSSFENQPAPQASHSSVASKADSDLLAIASPSSSQSNHVDALPTMSKQASSRSAIASVRKVGRPPKVRVLNPLEMTQATGDASILPSTEVALPAPRKEKKPRKKYVRKLKTKAKEGEPSPELPPYLATAYAKALDELVIYPFRGGIRGPKKMWMSRCMMDNKLIELDFLTSDEEDNTADNDKARARHPGEPTIHLSDLQDDLARFIYCKIATDFQKHTSTEWLHKTNMVLRLNQQDLAWVERKKMDSYGYGWKAELPVPNMFEMDASLVLQAFREQARRSHWMTVPVDDFAWTQEEVHQEEEVTQADIKAFKKFLSERGIDCEALPIDLDDPAIAADGNESEVGETSEE